MTMNPLPPQAYTKDILLKAYQWLMGQNTSLKEMATTPDILVSLYLKATRDGDHSLERPSIQNFKNELRALAGMMGELDRPPQAPKAAPPAGASFHPPVSSAKEIPREAPVRAADESSPKEASSNKETSAMSAFSVALDCGTLSMIQEVKEELNLSSEVEALRMLVKIGYSRSRSLLN